MIRPELLTTAQMALAEGMAIAAGTPGIELMERAGAAVAAAAVARAPAGGHIAIYCGPGNNGGDGFVAARILRERGYTVSLGLLGRLEGLKGDAAEAARRWGPSAPSASGVDMASTDLVVDALFGSGLARDLDGEARAIVEKLNSWSAASRRPVLAVDVPSGLDANTGAVRGVAVRATATLTFFRLRPGHLLMPGRTLCGELEVADIGIAETVLEKIQPQNFANVPALWQTRYRAPATAGHKYSRGHVLVVSGGPWSTGAARLAARGALRAGAGLATLASPRAALNINASHLTAIMLAPCDGAYELAAILNDQRLNAVVMGPGLGVGQATIALVCAALQSRCERAIILDADALSSFAGRASELAGYIRASGKPVILTPHEGEFARLFNQDGDLLESIPQALEPVSQVAKSPPTAKTDRARNAAARMGAYVLFKGPDTVVAAPDGRCSVSFDAPAWLATAGSGDVLAGMIGGLMAQGMPAFEAASAAVWMHAAAARSFGPGLISEDLPEALPGVLADLLCEA